MKFIFLLLLSINFLYSADLNTTIVNADTKYYDTLLEKITKQRNKTNESSLQKTLLLKILVFSNKGTFTVKKITNVRDQKEYMKLFNNYIDTLFTIKNLQLELQTMQEKSTTLLSQIKEQEKPLLTTQLFYTFYTKKYQKNNEKLLVLQKNLENIKSALIVSLNNIMFDKKQIYSDEIKIDNKISQFTNEIEQLKIKKERYSLLEKEKDLQLIALQIQQKELKEKNLYKQKLASLFLDFSMNVKEHAAHIIKEHKKITLFIKQYIENGILINADVNTLLTDMEKATFGSVETFKAQGLEEIQTEIENLFVMAQEPLFVINKTPISTLKLLLSLLIFIIGFFVGNFYKTHIKNLASKNKNINAGTHTLLANMGYYAIFLITFFIVLKVLGIDLSSIALVAGALSVGIGFGLQNIISNFVSGIILMVERSVKIGDYIELSDDLRGHVVDIKMRSITVNTNSNIDIIVPNQDLIQNRVINWTMNDKIRRFEIPFGVAYATEPEKVIGVILEAVQKSNFQDLYNTPERHTRVIMTGMGNSSVDFELFVWVKGKEILFPKRTTSRFLVLIYNTLYEHNIEIPFPQQDLHIRSIDMNLPIKIEE